MKYRKKPVVIEAIQFTGRESFCRMINFWKIDFDKVSEYEDNKENFFIETLEGTHNVSLNDFVIRGVAGEFYPCKPDIFNRTYEKVQE